MTEQQIEFENALNGISGPLQFVSKNEFERLDRVKGLEQTLQTGLVRAMEVATPPPLKETIRALLKWVPKDSSSREQRIDSLLKLQDGLSSISVGAEVAVSLQPSTKDQK